ncbi:MAG TPA: hypothetical protein VHH11_15030 [Gammaproteobacteria bacterium]|nr:hypothetical protein [Gammaproteobacteria bacterium]
MGFLEWLQNTPFGIWVGESLWAYPLFETMHTIGMAMVVGSLGLINLRVLGYKPELPILGTQQLLPLAWIGFTLNLVSGLTLFVSDAEHFWGSYTFRVKMVLIILGGINAALLGRRMFQEALPGAPPVVPTSGAKWIAATSLVFWFGAICAGRLIAYLP